MMARKLITIVKCPLCGKMVEQVPDSVLKQSPGTSDAELVVTRRGLKQYIHHSCWYKMIEEKRPYDGKLYM